MSAFSTIIQRFQNLPRAFQWLIFAVVAIVLFLIWDDQLRPVADRWQVAADEIEADVSKVRESSEMARLLNGRDTAEIVLAIGPVAAPQDDRQGGEKLQEAAFSVTREYSSVTDMSLDLRGVTGRLSDRITREIADGKQLSRLTAELKFVASPEDTIAILTDLENHPDIESVTAVRLTRSGPGTLKVNLDLEAWVEGS